MDIEQINKELIRCLGCKAKPCQKACPLGVSPHDFIMLAKQNNYQEAAKIIADKNPLPETCGLVCPDLFCQKACIRKKIDTAIEIPCLQAYVIEKAGLPNLNLPEKNGKKVAIIGGGPAGVGATYELIRNGYLVDIYEKNSKLGGVARLIPDYRLPKTILDKEIARITENDRVKVYTNQEIINLEELKEKYDDIILAIGEPIEYTLGITGEEHCISYKKLLSNNNLDSKASLEDNNFKIEEIATPNPSSEEIKDGAMGGIKCNARSVLPTAVYKNEYIRKVKHDYDSALAHHKAIVVGGGEVALDCALSLKKYGVDTVEMFVRRKTEDMRIMQKDHIELKKHGVIIRDLTSIVEIKENNQRYNIIAIQNEINEEGKARAIKGTEYELKDYDMIVTALGSYCRKDKEEKFLCAGDMTGYCGTVVQALASGMAKAREVIGNK